MIYASETDFAAKLKNYEPRPVYFLYGEQTYLKKMYLKKIVAKAVEPALADFNLSRFDAGSTTLDEISDAVESLPLLAPRKCVVVTDLDVAKLSAAENEKLKELLKDPPQTTVLVFVTIAVAVDMKKNAKWKAFLKLTNAVGDVVELCARSSSDCNRFLKTLAERGGCTLSTDCATYLTQRCGDDMQVLENEMNKLCAYKSSGAIAKADIDLCAIPLLDASVFDLSKLILKQDLGGALENLQELLFLREEPVMILGALSGSFVDMYRAKVARENSKTAADLASVFTTYHGKEWRVRNAMRDCDRYTKQQLTQILALLAKADYRLKSSKTDHVIILQEVITRILAVGRG